MHVTDLKFLLGNVHVFTFSSHISHTNLCIYGHYQGHYSGRQLLHRNRAVGGVDTDAGVTQQLSKAKLNIEQ